MPSTMTFLYSVVEYEAMLKRFFFAVGKEGRIGLCGGGLMWVCMGEWVHVWVMVR